MCSSSNAGLQSIAVIHRAWGDFARLARMTSTELHAYFNALGEDRYMPTSHASGAWREDELHLAPVAGLLIHHLERWRETHADPSHEFSRFSFEVLGQIAREEISLVTEVVRPGRTIELVETTAVIGGRVTIRARAWLLQTANTIDVQGHEFAPMPTPDECLELSNLLDWPGGFIRSISARQAAGQYPGRAQAWVTSDLDLVKGEASQTLAEFSKYLDTANGVAIRQKPGEWMFPNVDLTLHFFRKPSGRMVGLDTRVAFGASGIGMTSSVMHDLSGPVGSIEQSLTLRRMP